MKDELELLAPQVVEWAPELCMVRLEGLFTKHDLKLILDYLLTS